MVTIETNSYLPDGFFERLIIKIYSCEHLDISQLWRNGIISTTTSEGLISCIHEKTKNFSTITITAKNNGEKIREEWHGIIPILVVCEYFHHTGVLITL